MRARSLARRWALTPPFHPYPRGGGLFSVPLSASRLAPPLAAILPCGARTFLSRDGSGRTIHSSNGNYNSAAEARATTGLRSSRRSFDFEVEYALAVGAEMDLEKLLNLVVELRWKPHTASLAGAPFCECNRRAIAALENHFVSLAQARIDIRGEFIALDPLLGE
jgi:hypothetical protein